MLNLDGDGGEFKLGHFFYHLVTELHKSLRDILDALGISGPKDKRPFFFF